MPNAKTALEGLLSYFPYRNSWSSQQPQEVTPPVAHKVALRHREVNRPAQHGYNGLCTGQLASESVPLAPTTVQHV